ncbi:hypothetical protein R1flu_012761 [Riccia fluitans]|uniref:DNA-PKcs N-terminal domain-containing protein n=1 Tax=Riccia fluitans TaxID=41844 RepID=A0ABD1ZCN8_9MARC
MDHKLVRCMTSLKDEAEAARMGADSSDLNSLISDVSDLCKQALSDEDVSFAIALVFDREEGIFNVVQLLLPVKERSVVKARESCFTFVSEFIQQIGDRVLPHIEFVKEKCLLVFRRDDSKSVQAAALNPLLSLLETNITRNNPSVVNLDWMFGEVLLKEYRKAKTSGTLRSNILVLLGYLVEYFPRTFGEENVNTLLKICLDTLEEQLRQSSKDPVFVVVSGVMKCLDSLLTWFDESLPAGGSVETSRKIYTFLVQIIYYREDIKRYEVVKAGLRLLARHASLFALRLVQDSKDILSWLQIYCTHTNAPLRDAGFAAFNSFIAQVSRCLVYEESRVQNVQERYKHFMATFFGLLDAPYADKKLLSLAIRGLGKLSPLIVKFSGKETLKKVFHRLTSLGETPSSRGGEAYEDSLGHSVTLLGAFADMVIYFDSVEDFMVSFIAEVTGNIFYQFPNLFPKQRQATYITMSALFKAMYSKGTIFTIFLSNVVWSTLQRTMETTEGAPGDLGLPLWPQYVELWCHLLEFLRKSAEEHSAALHDGSDMETISGQSSSEERSVDVKEIQGLVFDSIVRSIMKALTELNLKYRVRPSSALTSRQDDADASPVEPETELELIEPLNLVHMRKYLNLVEFTQDFLSRSSAYLFIKWVYPFSCCVMELSHQYPLISGNYKLLTTTVKVADSKRFFQSLEACETPESDTKGMASAEEWKSFFKVRKDHVTERGPTVSTEHQTLCQQLFRRYLQEVLVASRRYKLELLASCLRFCLSAPTALIDIGSLVAPMQNAFKIGLRYPLKPD